MSEVLSMSAVVQQLQSAEATLPLIDATCRSQFLLHDRPTAKVILFFHGFTATPEQFAYIGKVLFEAGYNVVIPLLPGHGFAGDWSRDRPPPLPEDPEIYQQFGLQWLQKVRAFGDQVVIGGLSGGSTLSAWLALECYTQVDRALLFAPYLSNANIWVDLAVRVLDIYFEWKINPEFKSFGYKGFSMPALRAFLDMGQEVLDRAGQRPTAPMLILSSERDSAVNLKDHQALFKSALKYQPRSWYYCFDRSLDVPHNMMTQAEGNQYVDLLVAIAKAYVASNLTWLEVKEIYNRMIKGEAFDTAVADLIFQYRISDDFQAMMMMVNP